MRKVRNFTVLIFAIAEYCRIKFLDFVSKSQKLVQTKIDFSTFNALKTTIMYASLLLYVCIYVFYIKHNEP